MNTILVYKGNQLTYEPCNFDSAIAFNNNSLIDTSKYNFSYNSNSRTLITSNCKFKSFQTTTNIQITSEYTNVSTMNSLGYINGFHFLFTFVAKEIDYSQINSESSITIAIYINDTLVKEYSYFVDENDIFAVNIYDEFKCNKVVSSIVVKAKTNIPCVYIDCPNKNPSDSSLNKVNQIVIYY